MESESKNIKVLPGAVELTITDMQPSAPHPPFVSDRVDIQQSQNYYSLVSRSGQGNTERNFSVTINRRFLDGEYEIEFPQNDVGLRFFNGREVHGFYFFAIKGVVNFSISEGGAHCKGGFTNVSFESDESAPRLTTCKISGKFDIKFEV